MKMKIPLFLPRFFIGALCAYFYACLTTATFVILASAIPNTLSAIGATMFLVGLFGCVFLIPASGLCALLVAAYPARSLNTYIFYLSTAVIGGFAASFIFQYFGLLDWDNNPMSIAPRNIAIVSLISMTCITSSVITLILTNLSIQFLDRHLNPIPNTAEQGAAANP